MGLDYTSSCINLRDVGVYINLILADKKLKEGLLYRGGSIDYIKELSEINDVKTILNLKNSPDDRFFDLDYFHFPMFNKVEKYDTKRKEVRQWLNKIIRIFEQNNLAYPILIHCLSGKDRTGIVIAAILLIIGVAEGTIIEEYLLSDGTVREEWIVLALSGIRDIDNYFKSIAIDEVRKNLKKHLLIS